MKVAEAFVEIRTDTRAAEAEVKKQGKKLGDTFAQIFGAAAFGFALKGAIDAGSRLEQSVGGIEAVFGSAGRAVDKWAKDAARNMGLSEAAANEALTLIGAQLKNFGLSVQDARTKGMGLVELAGDLAATFGGTTTDAVEALTAALRGENDPIERYGVSLNDARLKAKALEMGLYDGKGALDSNARAQAALAAITDQTSAASGQFARELDTVAGKQAVAKAEAENSAASLGQALAPAYERVVEVVGFLAQKFGELPAPLQYALVALVGVAALAGPVGKLGDVIGSVSSVVRGLSTGMTALAATAGAVSALIGVAAVVYSVYNSRKQEATQRTNDLREALLGEAGAQNEALKSLAENDAKVLDFLATSKQLGVTTQDVANYVRDGAGAVGELADKIDRAQGSVDGIYPAMFEVAKVIGDPALLQGATNWQDWYNTVDQTTKDSIESIYNWGVEVHSLREAQQRSAETQQLVNDVTGQGAAVTSTATTATAGYGAALETTAASATKLRDAQFETIDTGLSLQQSYLNVMDALNGARASMADTGASAADQQAKMIALSQQVSDYAQELGSIPPQKVTEILAMLNQGQFDAAAAALANLTRKRVVPIDLKLGVAVSGGNSPSGTLVAGTAQNAGEVAAAEFASGFDAGLSSAASSGSGGSGGAAIGKSAADRAAEEARKAADAIAKLDAEVANKFEAGAITADSYESYLRKRLKGLKKFSDEWIAVWREINQVEAEQDREKDSTMANKYEAGAITKKAYKKYLEGRLKDLEKFSDEWMAVWRELNGLNEKAPVPKPPDTVTRPADYLTPDGVLVQHYARGGVFNRATLGVFGEAGPEAILPLSRPSEMSRVLSDPRVSQALGAAGSGGVVVNGGITVGTSSDLSDLERTLDRVAWRVAT